MEGLFGYFATGVFSFAVGYLLMYLQPKAKLAYWSPHNFLFNLINEDVVLQTDALTLQNLGRKTARNVEIVMYNRPDFFQFAPAIAYTETTLDNGQFVIRIAEMGHNEYVTLQLLSYTKVPQLLNIRSDAGQARAIEDFNKAIELNPKDAESYYNRGLAKIGLGQKDSGCLDLSKAEELGDSKAYERVGEYCK